MIMTLHPAPTGYKFAAYDVTGIIEIRRVDYLVQEVNDDGEDAFTLRRVKISSPVESVQLVDVIEETGWLDFGDTEEEARARGAAAGGIPQYP